MRAFIGISLSDDARAALARLQGGLGESDADVAWVAPALLHVTLKFLDEITDAQRQSVEALLTRLAGKEPAVLLGLAGLGAFPSVSAPRVVWVGLSEGCEVVARIAQAIERGGAAINVRREERPFAPHLTLGRMRSSRNLAALTQRLGSVEWPPPPPWRVSSLTLYQSVLGTGGSVYSVLGGFPLAA